MLSIRLPPPVDPRPHVDAGGPFTKLVGGWLCLDFVNTGGAWLPPAGGESAWHITDDRLTSYGDLAVWAEVAGALPGVVAERLRSSASRREAEATEALARARALRLTLHRLAAAHLVGTKLPEDALGALQAEARAFARLERLVERDGTVRTWWVATELALDAPLWPVVRSALALFADADALARLRRCDGERCGWLFVDASRGRRRRWCDMADCGNVAKVRALRARRRREKLR